MPDMIVPLYRLPARIPSRIQAGDDLVVIRHANTFEFTKVTDFIRAHFGQGWADEAGAAFARQPVSCFIALLDGIIVGFAAYESTRRGFFGPTGVDEVHRGKGIGRALLIASMWGLSDLGYGYGIIGGAGPVDFYHNAVNAIVIPDSIPGVYTDLIGKISTTH